jgi:hypothetical protein
LSGRKSKNKGKSYERDVANFLSELYGESFTRVPYSGAFVGGQNIKRTATLSEDQTRGYKGDIHPGPSFPRLVIEAKNYAEFSWPSLALNKTSAQLDDWIQQAIDSCEPGDVWLLCIKITRQGQFVLWDPNMWDMRDSGGNHYKQYVYKEYDQFWKAHSDWIKHHSQ